MSVTEERTIENRMGDCGPEQLRKMADWVEERQKEGWRILQVYGWEDDCLRVKMIKRR